MLHWIEFVLPQASDRTNWKRTIGICDETGRIMVPAAMAAREEEVLMCARFDATPTARYKDHLYVPSTWLANEFPDCAELCAAAEAGARRWEGPSGLQPTPPHGVAYHDANIGPQE